MAQVLQCLLSRYREWKGRRAPYFVVRTEQDLLCAAFRSAPWYFRWFRLSRSRETIRLILENPRLSDELALSELKRGAKVWPFVFNEYTLAMRRGYVLVRDGKARAAILTEVS
jgi:hypothetical protein